MESMTQREQIYAAMVAGDKTVRELMQITGINHPGQVRRELKKLREQGRAHRGYDNKWSVWTMEAVNREPAPQFGDPITSVDA